MFRRVYKGFAQLNVVLATFVVFLLASSVGNAQGVTLESFVRDMPKVEDLPANQQLEWRTVNDVSVGLSYTVRLPKDWEQDEELRIGADMLSELLMMEVASFRSPSRLEGVNTLSIQVQKMRPNYSLAKWFDDYRRDQNFSLAGFQVLGQNNIEFFFIALDGGISKIYRGAATQIDQMIVMTLYAMPQSLWGQEQSIQKAVMEQAFVTAQVVPRAINQSDFRHNFKGLLSFVVPQSWAVIDRDMDDFDFDHVTLREYSESTARAIAVDDQDVEIQDRDDAHVIHVFYVGDVDEQVLSKAVRQVHRYHAGQGNLYKDEPFEYIDNLTLGVGVRRGVIEVYKLDGNARRADQEHWLAILQGRNGYALVSTIAPTRRESRFGWGKLTRDMREVAESVLFLQAD